MTVSNLAKGRMWREGVALYLKLMTGLKIEMKPTHQKLSEAVLDEDSRDIRGEGLDNWHLNCRVENTRDISGALDQAEKEAKESGRHAATVWHRPGRTIGESYVILSLHTLAKLVTPPQRQPTNGTNPKQRLQDLL